MISSFSRRIIPSLLLIWFLAACTPSSPPTQPPSPTLPLVAVDTATSAPADTKPAFTPTVEAASPTPPPLDTAAPTQAPTLTRPSDSSAGLDGKALVEERCSVCHGLSRVQQPRTESEWRNIVDRMIGKGANLSVQEKEAVLQYLIVTYAK